MTGCGSDDEPSSLRNGEGGDEAGNRVPVRVVVSRDRIRVSDDVVPSFLAVRLRVVNRLDRRIRVVVEREEQRIGEVAVPARDRAALDVEGQRTGTLVVRAPGLGAGPATIDVRPGAG